MADTDIAETGIVPEIKALELCILGYVQFCQSVAEAIQMRKSRIGAEIKFGQGARTAHKVLELLVLRQVKTRKPLVRITFEIRKIRIVRKIERDQIAVEAVYPLEFFVLCKIQ